MAANPFSHIDLRVDNLAACAAFYQVLLAELGLTVRRTGDGWVTFCAEGEFPHVAFFGLTESPRHRPNENRIAFAVATRMEVDRLASVLRALDAAVSSGPRDCPEYSPTYYAVFFEDPAGNLLEILHRAG